jgi:hypothetical protein
LDLPTSWLPGVERADTPWSYDVIATLTGSNLSEGTKLRISLNGEEAQNCEPPLDLKGSWQTPKLSWQERGGSVSARIELVGSSDEREWVDVRDLTFFLRDELVESELLP